MSTAEHASLHLTRAELVHPDGRRIRLYGNPGASTPALPPGLPQLEPTALHLRCDALTGDWVAVSPSRNRRPLTHASAGATTAAAAPACPLCPGGPELPFPYEAAVFDNRFPSLIPDAPAPPDGPDGLIAASTGRCEVVCYTSQHTGSVATLHPEQVARVVAIWRDRTGALLEDPRIAAVLPFENRGEEVGATLSHPHGQLYAFDRLPPITARRVAALRRHRETADGCLSCRLVGIDAAAPERAVRDAEHFTVAVPYAARWPYEVHIRARRHGASRLTDLHPEEQTELALLLQDVVRRYDALYGFELPYLCTVQQAPRAPGAEDWHLSIELLPPHRGPETLKVRASVETATGAFINDTLPEASAAQLAELPIHAPPIAAYAAPGIHP